MFNKQRQDRELDDEIESHLQMHIEDNLRLGMTPDEARGGATGGLASDGGETSPLSEWGRESLCARTQSSRSQDRRIRRNDCPRF